MPDRNKISRESSPESIALNNAVNDGLRNAVKELQYSSKT
jgi:hypothetical protein